MVMAVRVTGDQRAVAILKAFNREAYKEISKGLKKAGEVVRDDVRDRTPSGEPLSGWGKWLTTRTSKAGVTATRDLSYDGGKVKAGIKVTTAQAKKASTGGTVTVSVATTTPAGSIYALSGSKQAHYNEDSSYRGRSFTVNLNKKSQKYARGLYEAAKDDKNMSKAQGEIAAVLKEAESKASQALGGKL
jgi:hypothetical protein